MTALLHGELSERIIGAFFAAYDELGFGFLEAVYRNALALELRGRGLAVATESRVDIWYKGRKVGHYSADFVVENRIIVEVKAVRELAEGHRAQLTNYLRATRLEVGLLMNFGARPAYERIVFSNDRKAGVVRQGDE